MNIGDFKISSIGETSKRPTLGQYTSVEVFRIVKVTLGEMTAALMGSDKGEEAVYMAGKAVGGEIYNTFLNTSKDLNDLIVNFKKLLEDLKVGVVSVVSADPAKGKFVVRVDECVTCSGTPNIGKPICGFEGGIIAGVLKGFTGKEVKVTETKCWGLGDNYCEFDITVQ